MRLLIISVLLAAFAFGPHPSGGQTKSRSLPRPSAGRDVYVGLEHARVPEGYEDLGGSLIGPLSEPQYAIIHVARGGEKMLWLERLTRRDAAGRPRWEIHDILSLPPVGRGQVLVYTTCYSGGQPDPEIVAVADYARDEEFFTRVRRAWRANRRTGKFEAISPRGVKCANEGFGV